MSENNADQIILLDSRSLVVRVLLAILVLLAIAATYYTARWQIGRMIADTASPADRNFAQIGQIAASLAPHDPFALWTAASGERTGFSPNSLTSAEKGFENAIRLSPNDYRYWLDLARTREQKGDRKAAETAFQKAVELAPNYAFPRWLMGNFYLRAGERERAFTEFRHVAASHSTLRQQVFYVAWENLGDDPQQIEREIGDAPQIRAALAAFYAAKGKPDDAVRVWKSLTPEQKEEFRPDGEVAARVLYEKQSFRASLEMLRDLGAEAPEIGQLQNPSFEGDITNSQENFLGWRVPKIKGVDVTLDAGQRREGKRSLRLGFNGFTESNLQAATQYVATESGARYRLTFALKTNELKSAGPPFLEIVDARTTKQLGASKPFAAGTNDWQTVAVEFTAPTDAEAVLIRTSRQYCGENCPIVGVVWYDDFKIESLGKTGK